MPQQRPPQPLSATMQRRMLQLRQALWVQQRQQMHLSRRRRLALSWPPFRLLCPCHNLPRLSSAVCKAHAKKRIAITATTTTITTTVRVATTTGSEATRYNIIVVIMPPHRPPATTWRTMPAAMISIRTHCRPWTNDVNHVRRLCVCSLPSIAA